ncbi:MAG: ankyrin repeat domain-containing protein [Paracoccaceae bacterium]
MTKRKFLLIFSGLALAVVFRASHLWPCHNLCDEDFWSASPSSNDVVAEIGLFTNLSSTDDRGRTPLHFAAVSDDPQIVHVLLEHGASIDAVADFGWTALTLSSITRPRDQSKNQAEIMKLLLSKGADPNFVSGSHNNAPLHMTAGDAAPNVIETLVAAGAEVNQKNRLGDSPLSIALRRNSVDSARVLIKAGANIKEPGLFYDAVTGSTDALGLLLDAGADPRVDHGVGLTGLHAFSRNDDVSALEALLAAGADINAQSQNGRTPLSSVLSFADPAIVRHMIAAGADPKIQSDSGATALQIAAEYDRPIAENITLAVTAGADPNRRDKKGRTPLHRAAQKGIAENVLALVQSGADVEALDEDKSTPLLVALKAGHLEAVEALIGAGADTNAKGFRQRTSIFYAASSENTELMALLLSLNQKVDQRDADNATPLILAAATGPVELLALLIDSGAAINARDNYDQTPLHFAARYADGDIVRFLVAKGADPQAIDSEGRKPWRIGYNNRKLRADAGAFNLLAD